ncbi:MAG: type B 50S ribosomal protein L31 [Pseudomonadota bacterium]
MRPDIHPEYRDVLFHDTTADLYYVIGSTVKTERTAEHEGKTYPYVTVEVSSASHPFYTGKQRVAQLDGRIAKFNKRFKRKKKEDTE